MPVGGQKFALSEQNRAAVDRNIIAAAVIKRTAFKRDHAAAAVADNGAGKIHAVELHRRVEATAKIDGAGIGAGCAEDRVGDEQSVPVDRVDVQRGAAVVHVHTVELGVGRVDVVRLSADPHALFISGNIQIGQVFPVGAVHTEPPAVGAGIRRYGVQRRRAGQTRLRPEFRINFDIFNAADIRAGVDLHADRQRGDIVAVQEVEFSGAGSESAVRIDQRHVFHRRAVSAYLLQCPWIGCDVLDVLFGIPDGQIGHARTLHHGDKASVGALFVSAVKSPAPAGIDLQNGTGNDAGVVLRADPIAAQLHALQEIQYHALTAFTAEGVMARRNPDHAAAVIIRRVYRGLERGSVVKIWCFLHRFRAVIRDDKVGHDIVLRGVDRLNRRLDRIARVRGESG